MKKLQLFHSSHNRKTSTQFSKIPKMKIIMKRKMIGAAAAYLAGLFFASFFTGKVMLYAFVGFLGVVLIKKLSLRDILLLMIAFGMGFGVSKAYTRFHYERITACSGSKTDFSGKIVEIERYSGEYAMYTVKGELMGIRSVKVNVLSNEIYGKYGDIIHIKDCTFSELENDYAFRNKDVFRAERVFLSAGYDGEISIERKSARPLKNALMDYRERMIAKIRREMGGDTGDFLCAMIFGEKRGFDPNVKTALYRSGIGHAMAVSGIHVSVIAVLVMFLTSRIFRGRFLPFILMNMVMLLFITMAEWPVSAMRAAVMIDFIYSARLFRRQSDTFNSLAAAVLLISISQPYVIYSGGFLLSITAAFGIGVFGPHLASDSGGIKIIHNFKILFWTNFCILPLMIKFFGETSLISPLTNLLLMPVCSAALAIGAIFVLTGGMLPLLGLAKITLMPVLWIAQKSSSLNFTYMNFADRYSDKIALILAAAIVVLYIIFENNDLTAWLITLSVSTLMLWSAFYERHSSNYLKIAFLGKNGGTTVVVSYQNVTRIFDIGGYHSAPVYTGKYLSENGVSRVESVYLTQRAASQYSSFRTDFSLIDVKQWYTFSDIYVSDRSVITAKDGAAFYDSDMETIFEDDGLIIDLNGFIVTAAADEDNNIIVAADYLDEQMKIGSKENGGINNFEIILTESGRSKIRRL